MSSLNKIWCDKWLLLPTKLRFYQALVLSILLYAADSWTIWQLIWRGWRYEMLAPCISWRDHITNATVTARTGDWSTRSCWHNRSLSSVAPHAHRTRCRSRHPETAVRLGRPPSCDWKRRPDRPRNGNNRWIDQLHTHGHWQNPGRSVEEFCATGSWKSDVTALAGYVLTTTTTTILVYVRKSCVYDSRRFRGFVRDSFANRSFFVVVSTSSRIVTSQNCRGHSRLLTIIYGSPRSTAMLSRMCRRFVPIHQDFSNRRLSWRKSWQCDLGFTRSIVVCVYCRLCCFCI